EQMEVPRRMDVVPIVKVFDALLTAGAAVALAATAFFVMLAGFQYMSAGGSVRAVEGAKGSLYHALIGLAIVIMCKIIAGLVGGDAVCPPAAPPALAAWHERATRGNMRAAGLGRAFSATRVGCI